MASPTRELFAPGKQARVSVTFSPAVAERINLRCQELGCDPKDYVKYAVMRELDQAPEVAPKICAACGISFYSRNRNRLYCSKRCTKRAERASTEPKLESVTPVTSRDQ